MRLSLTIFFIFLFASCTNQFDYKENKWKMVSQARKGTYEAGYIDENRIECADGKCRTWVKLLLGQPKPIAYGGNKAGDEDGVMMVKRVDASIDYDCKNSTALIISYQLYDEKDQMIDSKWIRFDPIYAEPGTVHGDIFNYVCKK